MPEETRLDTTEQNNRLRKFASFFKSYMGVMPLITAAVAPLLTMLKAIPVFEADRTTLATYTGLCGFLMVAWIFYARGLFVPAMVPFSEPASIAITSEDPAENARLMQESAVLDQVRRRRFALRSGVTGMLPLLLILLSIGCFVWYQWSLDRVVGHVLDFGGRGLKNQQDVLQQMGNLYPIPGHSLLQAMYIGIFLFAEAAFVVMALREYAYGILHISEEEVLYGSRRAIGVSAAPPVSMR